MDHEYRHPDEYNPHEILRLSEELFEEGNYGACKYYISFAVGVAQLNQGLIEKGSPEASPILAEEYKKKAEQIASKSRQEMFKDLLEHLADSNVVVNQSNLEILMQEHSGHWSKYKELADKFGTNYSFKF